jgi:CubicO group peptidase (beta-lactamase class C family)
MGCRPMIAHTVLDTLIAEYAARHHCPTLAWGIVDRGALVASGGIGDVDGEPVDEHTVYRIASMTKSFSAAATLWLRDRGVLALDDPIDRHAPELAALRGPTSDAPTITIRDLLTMTSGLATDDPWADRHLDLTDDAFDAIVDSGAVFAVATGTTFEYSNFGFAVLGRVVQRASGRRIQDVVSRALLAPLGMRSTTWIQPVHGRWAPPTRWHDDAYAPELEPLDDGLIAPMGGIWTTVADLATWVTWLDDAFPARDGDDDGPLCRASRREMQTVQRYVGQRTLRDVKSPGGYGYGLRVLDEPVGTVITHSGGLPGYGSNMRWLHGRGIGAIALANVTYAPMTELTARMLDTLQLPDPPARPVGPTLQSCAERLVALLNDWDDDRADALFSDNVADDESWARRRSDRADRLADAAIAITDVRAVNDSDATITCTAGELRVTITFSLSPPLPARIQEYDLTVAAPDAR